MVGPLKGLALALALPLLLRLLVANGIFDMHKTGESVDYRIAAWRFPKSWGIPQIIQVMDDHSSIETHGDMVISFFYQPAT
jgi:hypothetical protein